MTEMQDFLPEDGLSGCLVTRIWIDHPAGPRPCVLREDGVYDLSSLAATMSDLIDLPDPSGSVRSHAGTRLCTLEEAVAATFTNPGGHLSFLAPNDLQAIKAAGVTFADSMLERVIEERAKGDADRAASIRKDLQQELGLDLASIKPGSVEAELTKTRLSADGLWSQYLEVGLGPDAEIFTKAQVLSAVGTGALIGIHPKSSWNNPEPEVVLAVSSSGEIKGATLGNDVNLRDFEGRSALLLSKAKDNNASCAIGPFIRLFDDSFTIDDVRNAELTLKVTGTDQFTMAGSSSMRRISRDPVDLAAQTYCAEHQYPDGFMLYLGTLFAPTQDRDAPGKGFTHKVGDTVSIHSPKLGTLRNEVTTSDRAPRWTFGIRELMKSLSARELIVAA
jgi:fumarylacetoacetate (FAA) hydrolase family protein